MTLRDSEIVRQEIEAGGPKAVLSGLIFSCPRHGGIHTSPQHSLGSENPAQTNVERGNEAPVRVCPLRPIRCLHTADRYRWLLRLSDEQAAEIVKKHSDCIGGFEK
ncbi:MAG: hypothetical protein A2X49_05740 [Lentisphaerae bacterium GWF2_52_8]|nr:MAG: hypothetical protein A2X49_05740 [Lentisphaerae bacterium GWF2_52_8]